MPSFEDLLAGSAQAHGHLCPGQVIGVRMALLGLKLLGMNLPLNLQDLKNLLVYIEMDRCAGDAVAHVTGVRLGRRSLKFVDYGIMAATFVRLDTRKAFRIISNEEARRLAQIAAPEETEPGRRQVLAYQRLPDRDLFFVQAVDVDLEPWDLPGPTRRKVACSACGQVIRDGKERFSQGRVLCRPCAEKAYFSNPRPTIWPDMDWAPEDKKLIQAC